MMRIITTLILICGLMIAAGCDDGPAVDPDLTGVVVDESGEPVAGVAVGIVYRLEGFSLPGDWDKTYPDKPQTRISFDLPDPQQVRLEILSYDRELVRVLVDNELPAGIHGILWDAADDSGQLVPPGWYFAMITRENEPVEETGIFLYYFEPEEIHRSRHATTNSQGKFRISRDLLPLGEVLVATDELGETLSSNAVSREFKVLAVLDRDGVLTSTSSIVTLDESEAGINIELVLP